MLWLQACNRQNAYCVPLYDTLGPDAVEYIIGHAEITVVFASAIKMRALVEPLIRSKGKVEALIVWGEVDGIAQMVRHLLITHAACASCWVLVAQQCRRQDSVLRNACSGIVCRILLFRRLGSPESASGKLLSCCSRWPSSSLQR